MAKKSGETAPTPENQPNKQEVKPATVEVQVPGRTKF